MAMKPCGKCGGSDRYKNGECRPCHKAAAARYQKANPEKIKADAAKYYKVNSERIKAAEAKRYKVNPERIKAAKARYRKANIERIKAAEARYRKANREKIKADAAKYRKANPEKRNVAASKWAKANPEKCRIHKHNRRALKRTNGGRLSPDLAETLYKRQKGFCVCCNQPLGKAYHLDHIMPLKSGGKNEDWNMQLLTATCNHQKGARHPIEFMQSKGLLL